MHTELSQGYSFGPFTVDTRARLLLSNGQPVTLAPKAFDLLCHLVEHPQMLLTKERLMTAVWPRGFVEEGNLSQNIFLLRKVLGESKKENRFIATVPGKGYQFTAAVTKIGPQCLALDAALAALPPGAPAMAAIAKAEQATPPGPLAQARPPPAPLPAPFPLPERQAAAPEALNRAAAGDPPGAKWRWNRTASLLALLGFTGFAAYGLHETGARRPDDAREPGGWFAASAPARPSVHVSVPMSIAVLPFRVLLQGKTADSSVTTQIAAGLQDEITTRLVKIGTLKVISGGSATAANTDEAPLKAKFQQLGVANLLTGRIQDLGDKLRVTVSLIAADGDQYLWAETYVRPVNRLFGVESEVASAVVSALNAQITEPERVAVTRRSTGNPEAYQAYLMGRAAYLGMVGSGRYRTVAQHMEQAVQLDPTYAEAWSELSIARGFLYLNGIDGAANNPESIKFAADRAISLAPNFSEAHLALGAYRYRALRDYPGARAELEAALAASPNDARVLSMLGWVEQREGRFDAAIAHLTRASELDPLNARLMTSLGGETLVAVGRWDEARIWLRRSLAIQPGDFLATRYLAFTYQQQGNLRQTDAILATVKIAGQAPEIAVGRAYQRLLERRYEQAIEELKPVTERPPEQLNGFAPQLLAYLMQAQYLAGRIDDANGSAKKLIREIGPQGATQVDDAQRPILLAQALFLSGQSELGVKQARDAVTIYGTDFSHLAPAVENLAFLQSATGDLNGALSSLEQVQALPYHSSKGLMKLDPRWDALRHTPQFAQLIL